MSDHWAEEGQYTFIARIPSDGPHEDFSISVEPGGASKFLCGRVAEWLVEHSPELWKTYFLDPTLVVVIRDRDVALAFRLRFS